MDPKTKLFALVANDPSHPAVLDTLCKLFNLVQENRKKFVSLANDAATLILIEIMLEELETTLEKG